jgi:hypothetical protein
MAAAGRALEVGSERERTTGSDAGEAEVDPGKVTRLMDGQEAAAADREQCDLRRRDRCCQKHDSRARAERRRITPQPPWSSSPTPGHQLPDRPNAGETTPNRRYRSCSAFGNSRKGPITPRHDGVSQAQAIFSAVLKRWQE